MKNRKMLAALPAMGLALLMTQGAFAEPSDAVKGIYDALVAEDSAYSAEKATYTAYFPDIVYEETLEDDGFTITVSGSEYMDGSWTFTEDGDYLVTTVSSEDYMGVTTALDVLKAAGSYYGMNTDVLNGYITGLNLLGLDNPYFIMEDDGEENHISVYSAGAFEMEGLDEMLLEGDAIDYEPLGEDWMSMASSIGKMMMIANGSVDDLTILIGENGGLDDLAYQSIINVVSTLQPTGWEAFVEDYTELADAEGDGYTVTVDPDAAAVDEIIDDPRDGDSYVLLHFGE